MIQRKKIESLYFVLSTILLLWANNGLFSYVNIYLPAIAKYSLFGICILVATVLDRSYLKKLFKNILPLLFFILLSLLSLVLFKMEYVSLFLKSILYLIIIYSQYLYYENSDIKWKKRILLILAIDYICLAISTIRELNINPNISRLLATGNLEYVMNVGGYSFIYSSIIFIYYCIDQILNNNRKIIYICLLCLLVTLLFKGGFTISYLLFAICLIIYIIMKLKNKKKYFSLFLIITTIVFSFSYLVPILLNNVKKSENVNYEVRYRASELLKFYNGENIDGTDMDSRLFQYQISINQFSNNIFVGTFGEQSPGGHASWLDLLASFGLLSIAVFVFQHNFFRGVLRKIDKSKKPLFITIVLLYYFQGLINTVLFFNTFLYVFFAIPILLENNFKDGDMK